MPNLYIFLIFRWRHLQDRQVDIHQIFQEDDKWAATEKLSFWFLNSFGDEVGVQKGHFRLGPSFTLYNMAAKRIYLSKNKPKLSDFGRIISVPNAENHAKICQLCLP